MAYYLGRDVSVTLAAGDDVGVSSSAIDLDETRTTTFATKTNAGLAVSDLTGVDLGIGVTDEDITYMGSRTVLKAEIKKETTVSLTRKKKDNTWDVVFNGGARWGAYNNNLHANLAGEPDLTVPLPATQTGVGYFGYQLKITLSSGVEVFTIPHCQITAHTVTLNADGTTEETMEFISQEDPTIAST